MELIFGEDTEGPCNKRVRHLDDNLAKKWPIIGEFSSIRFNNP